MTSIFLLSDTRRVRGMFASAVSPTGVTRVLVIDAAGPDLESRGGSAAAFYKNEGISFEVCDPLTEALPDLNGFDGVHMSGGNPFRLLMAARRCELSDKVLDASLLLVVGVSAGAMVMGTDIAHARILQPDLGIRDASGFGWVPHLIMPHVDMNGKYGDVIRDHLNAHESENWLRLKEESLLLGKDLPAADFMQASDIHINDEQSSFDFL